MQLIEESDLEVPQDIKGEDITEQRNNYAEVLTRVTEVIMPTRVMAEVFKQDRDIDSDQLDRFFTENTTFEFRNQSIRGYLQDNPEALADFTDPATTQLELEAMQRVFHLSPVNERRKVAKVLWKNQLHSAWAISLAGEGELQALFDDDKDLVYRLYQGAQQTTQISQQIQINHADMQLMPSIGFMPGSPDLESLFGGLDYCECKHCLSFFSPSAYLVDLFLYLKKAKLTQNSAPAAFNTVLEKLFQRRPDLANIDLNCDNALTVLPYIDLVNETLENTIHPRNYEDRNVKIGFKNFTLPVAVVPQTQADPESLQAFPEHLNPEAYRILQKGVKNKRSGDRAGISYPWNLPFSLWLTEVRAYLNHLTVPRWQLMQSVLAQQNGELDTAIEFLGFNNQEKSILLDEQPGIGILAQYWGLGTTGRLSILSTVKKFLQQSGFNYQQLGPLFSLRYIQNSDDNKPITIQFDPASSCQIKDAKLNNLDEQALSRIHRFTRLQRKVTEPLITVDQTVMALGGEINEMLLLNYADVKWIEKKLPRKIDRDEILSWWNLLDTHNYDFDKKSSFYDSLFLRPGASELVEDELKLNEARDELAKVHQNNTTIIDLADPNLEPDLLAAILAALRWSSVDLKSVVASQWDELLFELTLSNLSNLYRISSFCRALRISVSEYLSLKALVGIQFLTGPGQIDGVLPKNTLAVIKQYQLLQKVKIEPDVLDYLLRHQYSEQATFTLSVDEAQQILFDLKSQLTKLLNEADPQEIKLQEKLQVKLSRVLLPEDVIVAQKIIELDPELTLNNQQRKDFFDEKMLFFPDANEAKTLLIDGGLTELERRYLHVLDALSTYIVEHAVIQQLAELLSIPTQLMDVLLRKYLRHPGEPGLPAISIFFVPEFLDPEEGDEHIDQVNTLLGLQKIALISERLQLNYKAIGFILQYGVNVGLPDLSLLPTKMVANSLSTEDFETWLRLMDLVSINQRQFYADTSVFDIFAFSLDPNNTQLELFELLHTAASWDINDINFICTAGLNLSYPANYQQATWLVELAKTISQVKKIGVSAKQIGQWAGLDVDQAQADSVRHAVKAKYGNEQWLEITSSLRDHIREQQRDALLAYVLHYSRKHNNAHFEDVDDLYGYYLIDPQMSACTQTSRTVLASSSVQLFMQRIMLNLEPGIEISRKHAEEWKWRKYYRIWEANRKVFLWPENWIEPELRDNKSPFFKELENELLQDELNEETVERVMANYLYKLDEVARLEICAVNYENETGTLHIFGRTASNPHTYFYRRWENRQDWTAWEIIELDIYNAEGVDEPQTGALLLPCVYNQRLYLFWPVFTLKQDDPYDNDEMIHAMESMIEISENNIEETEIEIASLEKKISDKTEEIDKARALLEEVNPIEMLAIINPLEQEITDIKVLIYGYENYILEQEESIKSYESDKEKSTGISGLEFYTIKMFYSEYRQGHWTVKKATEKPLVTPRFMGDFTGAKEIHRYFFRPMKTSSNDLLIFCYYSSGTKYYPMNTFFVYDSCRSELKTYSGSTYTPNKNLPDHMWYMKAKDDASGSKVPLRVTNSADEVDKLLKTAEKHHLLCYSMEGGVHKQTTPFFYEDKKRTFFVKTPDPYEPKYLGGLNAIASATMAGKATLPDNEFVETVGTFPLQTRLLNDEAQLLDASANLPMFYQANDSEQVLVRQEASVAVLRERNTNLSSRWNPQSDGSIVPSISENRFESKLETFEPLPSGHFSANLNAGKIKIRVGNYIFRTFYHPYTCLFLKQLNRYGVEGLLNPDPDTDDGNILNRQATPDHEEIFNFDQLYDPNNNEVNRFLHPKEIITFDYDDAYASYNWEVFFHIPLMIATRLYQDQRFELAQQWFHYIFNPTETEGAAPYRFWKTKPFHSYTRNQMESDMEALLKGEKEAQVKAWQKDPFNPHLLARFRRLAYMKTTLMKYLDNLIAWGDQLYRRDSIESINEATQLYVLAGQILGKLPVATDAKQVKVKTFTDLANQLDDLGNAWVEIELSQMGSTSRSPFNNNYSDPVPYFCFPPNEKLLAYWDTVADRLFKIRHCMNLEGVVRQLPLFQPPIDPALLVRAAASGMDLSSALNDLYAPIPKYRFNVMIRKAQEICQELKSLGSSLLSALEKKDAEALSLIRTQQEAVLLKANREIRSEQIKEAKFNLKSLEEQRELADIRHKNYQDREFINSGETSAAELSLLAALSQVSSAKISANAVGLGLIPDVTASVHTTAMCSGGSINTTIGAGGSTLSAIATIEAKSAETDAVISRELANMSSTLAQYTRRQEDWDLQLDLAKQEKKQIDQQLLAFKIRIAIAEKEKENLKLQIEHSQTVNEYMKNKYTHKQLYSWMIGQLASVYFQTYQLAFDIAKQAEKTFQHELGLQTSNYIQFGYWDNLRKGLLSGERLSLDLKRLEMAYMEQNRREFELSKHISLALLDPLALVKLRETGRCFIDLPEEIFDLDYPGHYFRRIKSASLTLPCIVGPFTTVSCTLRLLKNTIRNVTTNGQKGYARNTTDQGLPADDVRFVESNIPVKSVATSRAQNDSGVFELNFREERYLPFEGAGAVSQWSLELFTDSPENNPDFGKPLRQFDYNTISDAILHLRYTAREDMGPFKNAAVEHLREYYAEDGTQNSVRMFDLKREFSSQWQRFLQPTNSTMGNVFELDMSTELFSYRDQGKILKITTIILLARCSDSGNYEVVLSPPPPENSNSMTLAPSATYGGMHFAMKDTSNQNIELIPEEASTKWRLKLTRPGGGDLQTDDNNMEIEDLLMVLGYEWE